MSADKAVDDQKVDVGSFTFVINSVELKQINEKIGDVLEAQIIFRGSDSLGFGRVAVKSEEEVGDAAPTEGEIQGSFAFAKRGSRRGRAKAARGGRAKGGRARRSADDPDSLTEGNAPTSEAAAQNGEVSVKAVTDGVAAASLGEAVTDETTASGGDKTKGGRGAKGARGAKAARGGRAARAPRPRGELSKTLVYIRNLPYSFAEADVEELFKSSGLSYTSISVPTWKFGMHKGKGRGFAFANVEDQAKVLETLNGKEITGPASSRPALASTEEGAEKKEGEGEAEAAKPTTRSFKLVARQGYENEEKEKAEGEEGEDSVEVTDKNGNETSADAVVVAA